MLTADVFSVPLMLMRVTHLIILHKHIRHDQQLREQKTLALFATFLPSQETRDSPRES